MTTATDRTFGGRSVAALNATVATALVALLGALALVVNPPAPPGIAEFAPQAAKPITKAPQSQGAQLGVGRSGCAPAAVVCPAASSSPRPTPTGGPAAAGRPTGVPSALQCFTWPDGSVTQTFDPQSPPCIASWPGAASGNGGATTPGVTATSIRVAFPQYPGSTTVPSNYADLAPLVSFINTRFQLYGRRIVLVPFASQESASFFGAGAYSENPQYERADAKQAVSLHVFASTDYVDSWSWIQALPIFMDTLADAHVVSLAGGQVPPMSSTSALAQRAPYEWSYYPTSDVLMADTAAMVCTQLARRPATYSGGFPTTTRKFAVAVPTTSTTAGPLPGLKDLVSRIGACSGHTPKVVYFSLGDTSQQAAEGATMAQLKQEGVTSVVLYPGVGTQNADPRTYASQADYEPEWVTIGWDSHVASDLGTGQSRQNAATFGLAAWNKLGPQNTLPWYQAYLAAGGTAARANAMPDGAPVYHELLMLASGVQMAGPHLTPQTFAAALDSTRFPNPGAGAPPAYQARVGFEAGMPEMTRDFAQFWLDPSSNTASIYAHSEGTANNDYLGLCYVALGRRWSSGTWPATPAFFRGPCR